MREPATKEQKTILNRLGVKYDKNISKFQAHNILHLRTIGGGSFTPSTLRTSIKVYGGLK